jgi:methyltransferase (TIGR00027 family)
MTRSGNDTWNLATSVGVTATMVAAARAAASRQACPIINDPFAELLVSAVGIDFFARLAGGDLDFAVVGGDVGSGWMPEFFAVRARFFDDVLAAAGQEGIRQVAIVASGLDSRAYRLAWPTDTVVYEIDRPEVIEFKSSTLAKQGVDPTTHVRTVGVDLRQDWPTALREARFDPTQPTAWIVEGLLIGYLPGDAQDRLLDSITTLSAPSSRIAADYTGRSDSIGSLMQAMSEHWRRHGFDAKVAFNGLMYTDVRNDVERYLRPRGWETTVSNLKDLFSAAEVTEPSFDLHRGAPAMIEYLIGTRP